VLVAQDERFAAQVAIERGPRTVSVPVHVTNSG
jgi:hypothetical protein